MKVSLARFYSLRPRGLYPTGLLCPQNFPGKKTGVGCHYPTLGHPPDPGIEPWPATLLADS